MDIAEFLKNLPGPNRFLVIMSFLLVIMFLTYRNMRKRTKAERELNQRLDEMSDALDQKNNRIEEIHHRVKNNLQMISSMIGLQARECEDPELTERMRKCRSRVHNIAMIHDLLNESVEEDHLKIKPYLERLIYKSIQMNYGDRQGIDVRTEIDSMTVDAETATSCALIISELLTNCFQHAFDEPSEGRVEVRYERINGSISLDVSDNGVGFPSSVLEESVSNTGHEIVRSITKSELDGDVSFQNTDDGARVRIRFPLTEHAASPEPVRH